MGWGTLSDFSERRRSSIWISVSIHKYLENYPDTEFSTVLDTFESAPCTLPVQLTSPSARVKLLRDPPFDPLPEQLRYPVSIDFEILQESRSLSLRSLTARCRFVLSPSSLKEEGHIPSIGTPSRLFLRIFEATRYDIQEARNSQIQQDIVGRRLASVAASHK